MKSTPGLIALLISIRVPILSQSINWIVIVCSSFTICLTNDFLMSPGTCSAKWQWRTTFVTMFTHSPLFAAFHSRMLKILQKNWSFSLKTGQFLPFHLMKYVYKKRRHGNISFLWTPPTYISRIHVHHSTFSNRSQSWLTSGFVFKMQRFVSQPHCSKYLLGLVSDTCTYYILAFLKHCNWQACIFSLWTDCINCSTYF
jgi:hypothetical protein